MGYVMSGRTVTGELYMSCLLEKEADSQGVLMGSRHVTLIAQRS